MQAYRIEKRLPFGFVGDWGKLYKRYTVKETTGEAAGEIVTYEKNRYRDIGEDVQFKKVGNNEKVRENILPNVIMDAETTIVKTADAFWNDEEKQYDCIVQNGDIIRVFNKNWLVSSMQIKSKYTPIEQKIFYLAAKKIDIEK